MATLELKGSRRDVIRTDLEARLEPAQVFRGAIEEPRAISVKMHLTTTTLRGAVNARHRLPDADDGVMDTSEVFRISGRHDFVPVPRTNDRAEAPPAAFRALPDVGAEPCGMTAEEVYPKPLAEAASFAPSGATTTRSNRPVLSTERTQRRAAEPLSREGDEPLVIAGVGLVGAMVTLLVMLFLGYGAG